MTDLLHVAAIALVTLWIFERLRPLANRYIQSQEDRQRVAKGVDLPHDLQLIVMSESEEWARDQTESRFRELYSDLGSWEKVRAYVTPGANGSAGRS